MTAGVASCGKFVGVAIAAINLFISAAEGFVYQTVVTDATHEAPLVPMLLFVREIL